MNKNVTHMVFIVDQSGSMGRLVSDTIGGFNTMLDSQKKTEGEAIVTTVLFNNRTRVLHNMLDIQEIADLSERDYRPMGSTALLDAVGETVSIVRRKYADTLREERPDKVIFVITTDGMENASRHYNTRSVKKLVEEVQEKYNWEFIFMGANIDAFGEAAKIGIRKERSVRYHADEQGTRQNYQTLSRTIHEYRTSGQMDDSWAEDIKKDFEKRNK